MSEATAGSIVGFLSLNADQFYAAIEKAQLAADKLDTKDVNVQVKVDSAGAETKLAAVAASEDKVDQGNVKVAKSSKDAGNGMGLLSMAIVGLGPAIVPLAAGATGLAVGFGAMGAAGILAIVGINQQMKAGTALGGAYTSMVGTLKGDLATLGKTAASGVLGPFQASVADLQTRMPALNGVIGEFSVITGKTAGALTTGLVAAFIALEPLARDAGVYILGLSQQFAALMSGPGVVSFGDYVRSVFPQVMQSVESIVGAVLHLVAALAPLGMGSLSMLKTFADLLNAMPVDVLAVLAQGAVSVYIGFKTFSLLSGGITAVSAALTAVGVSAETAAVGMRALNIAAGVIGAVIAVATLLFSAHAESARKDQDAVNALTDAYIRNNGALDQQIINEQADALAKDGTLQAAKLLGYAFGDVTLASLGNVDAMARVTAHTNDLVKAYGGVAPAAEKAGKSLRDGMDAYTLVNNATKDGVTQSNLATEAAKAATAARQSSTVATGTLTTATLLGMTAAQQATSTDKSQIATIKTLNATMDEEISRNLALAGATSGVDQAVLNMNTALKANKGTLNEHTQAGISDRQAIEAVAGSLQSQRDAQIKAGASAADATAKYQTASAALLDQTGKLDGTKSAAYKYLQQLLAIPPSVKTAITANTTQAVSAVSALQGYLDRLHDKSITLTVYQQNSVNKLAGMGLGSANGNIFNANGNILKAFAGGSENHVAQIAPAGAMRLWAEPETGGEAYIPLAPAKRARSTAIYDEVGKILGKSGQSSGYDSPAVLSRLDAIANEVATLGKVVHTELQSHARTTETMRRQYA